jgi:hypothetical protein
MISVPNSAVAKMGGLDAKISFEKANEMQHELLNPKEK